jgi:DNA-binding Lrp family transcriptional regulator
MPGQGEKVKPAGPRKRRVIQRSPAAEEVAILRLLAEQQAIPLDQLACFFEVYVSDMTRVVEELEVLGWVVVEEVLVGYPAWIWLTHPGARLSGTGFVAMRPVIKGLAHTRGINEARLLARKLVPEGRWICERQLRRKVDGRVVGRVPDAVLEVDGERQAIEVELSRKGAEDVRRIIVEHSARYDAVVYLCSPPLARWMKRLELTSEFANLVVRELSEPIRSLQDGAGVARPLTKRREPSAYEVDVFDLLAEQGAIPLDQLARFLGRDEEAAGEMVASLVKAGFVYNARPFVNEPEWIWLGYRGVRYCGRQLRVMRPKLGALAKCRVMNELRLHLAERMPGGQWVSGRSLRQAVGKKGSAPAAMMKINGERHAIEVRLGQVRRTHLEELIDRRHDAYDVVVFFAVPRAYRVLKRLEAEGRWPNLVVERLFECRFRGQSPARPVEHLETPAIDALMLRLREAVEAGELKPSRARSIAGYVLLAASGVPQGASRTIFELERDCRELGLSVSLLESLVADRTSYVKGEATAHPVLVPAEE